jgi:hypothetical protein
MRLHARAKQLTATFAVLGLLTACGGGGDESAPANSAPPAGAYQGTASNGLALRMLLLDNNELWALYGTPSGSALLATGFIQGSGTANAFTYTTTNAKDFPSALAPVPVTGSASYTGSGILSGSLAGVSFTGSAIPSTVYNYATPAVVANVAGTWTSSYAGFVNTVIVTGNSFSGSSAASGGTTCTFTGTITPHASGKNVFAVVATFGATPGCNTSFATKTTNGIAIAYDIGGGQKQLLVGVVNAITGARDAGAVLAVVK